MKKQRPPISFDRPSSALKPCDVHAESSPCYVCNGPVNHLRGYKILTLFFALLISSIAYGQNKIVTGKIIDSATTLGVSGASVRLAGTTRGTITDVDGNFKIEARPNATLHISAINYKAVDVPVDFTKPITVSLSVVNKALAEVVVIGYGTAKRSDVTGSVSSVPKDRLEDLPSSNVLESIEGTVAGVTISGGSNVPGESPSVLVRGVNTINGQTAPLIVIDGVPFENISLNDISTNDIASIDILKDVSAVAIYGTRGSNGVILVTTKRGNTGKASVSLSSYAGIEGFAHKVNPMGPAEYIQKYADYKAQAGIVNGFAVPNLFEQQNIAAGRTTNWLDQISQGGFINNQALSISGGNKDVKYYVSGNYFDEKGILKGYQNKRGSIRSNIDATITKYLNAGINLYFVSNNQDGGRVDLYQAASVSPYGSVYNPDGSYSIFPMQPEELIKNPLLGLLTTRNQRRENLISNVYAEIKPLEGLKYRINAGYTYLPSLFQSYVGRNAGDIAGGTAFIDNAESKKWIVENILTYEKNWGKSHIDFTGLYSAQKNTDNASSINAVGFINDALQFNALQGANTFSAVSQATITSMVSQMLRVNYSFDSRYLLTATARRDGYSAFGANTSKYGLFPSVAAGWNISNENFMKSLTFVDNLKLRASYGISGNQSAVIPNSTITTFTTTPIPSNGKATTGLIADILGNNNLKWESTYGSNIGLDFSLFKGRVSGTIEEYNTRTKDLVLYRTLPSATGYLNVVSNVGKVSNQGLEITIKTQNIVTANFKWETTFNLATNKNMIIDLYGDKKDDIGNRLFIGQPVNVIYDYKQTGVWKIGEDPSKQDPGVTPGDLKFADLDHSGTITSDGKDQMVLGQSLPKWTGGLTSAWRYKNFRLSVFVQTVQGVMKDNEVVNFADVAGRQNLPSGVGYWTTTNQSNTRPILTYVNYLGYGYPKDASFTRIKDATISYTFPKEWINKLNIGALNIYVTGKNLATFTKWVGWDPEANYAGVTADAYLNYPLVRTFILGANITLR